MKFRSWLAAGQTASVIVGVAVLLGLVSAGVTREVPYGKIAGRITMLENGRALPEAEIVLRPVREARFDRAADDPGLPRYRYARTDDDGSFRINFVTEGKYMIEAYGSAHEMEPVPLEIVEGKTADVTFALKPRAPSLDLYASQHVFMPSEKLEWDLHGFADAEKIKVELFRLQFDRVVKEGTLYNALAPLARRDGKAVDPASLGEKVLEKEDAIVGRDVEGTFRLNQSLEAQSEGIYWLRCSAGPLSAGTYFSVSQMALVMKRAGTDVLTFASRLDTGEPVVDVSVGYVRDGAFVAAGSTDGKGLARFRLPGDLPEKNLVVLGRKGTSSAFVDFYNGRGSNGKGHIYLFTDRPVYRPGDEVGFKGIVRNLAGSEYRVPAPGPVQIQIRDADENLVATQTLLTNFNGTFSGKFSSQTEATPGVYRIEAKFGEIEGDHGVMVAAYRKPNYTIKVYPEKEHYIRGEKVRMIVECQYYFGGPVGGAKVDVNVFRAPTWTYYDPDEDEGYDYGGDYGGEWFTDAEAVTDSSGKAVVEFDSRLKDEEKDSWTDVQFNVTASVADEAGAYFEGKGSVEVSAGEFSLVPSTNRYVVEKGQPFEVTFETKDPSTRKSVGGKSIKVVAGYEFWDGRDTEWKPFATRALTTGPDGKATVVVTPLKGGSVAVRASAQDEHGNEIKADTYVWCSSREPGYEVREQSEPLTLRLDKKEYDPGETAKLLIACDEPGATALLTIEADRLYSVQSIKLDSKTQTLDLPVRPEYAPNVYVSVCYVKDKQFQRRQRRLVVDLGKKTLNASVTAERSAYKPGETVRYRIRTTDDAGRPAPCEVSLSVVDEAIYAIREDDTDLAGAFYPIRYNEVDTAYSFYTLYLDGGDKAPPDIEIRRVFKDTAYWNPAIQTDAKGEATVDVKLPDNLTTWRATVQAVDARTAVGEGVGKIVAKKDLMIRLQTPAFYVAGDVQRLAASVTNQSGKDADVQVDLTLAGAETGDQKRRSIRLKDGETKALEWQVTAPEVGEAVYTARAWIDDRTTDGVEGRVPIRARGRTERSAFSGDIAEAAILTIPVKETAERSAGGVQIALSPNLAAPLFQSLDDLIDFPYGCVEQTMSRFMPAVVVSKVVSDLGLPKPRRADQLPRIAAESYARLGRMQHYDGSWGWWEYDSGNTYMTAYVLEGIFRARQAGYPERNVDLDRALKWAETRLKEELPTPREDETWWLRTEPDSRAYLAYAVLLHRRSEAAIGLLGRLDLAKLNAEALAHLTQAYARLGSGFEGRRDAALSRMKAQAQASGGRVSWEEHYWGVESTSRCLQALAAVDPQSVLIPGALRQIMLKRRGYFWTSTRDTAFALLAVSDYLKAANVQFGDASVAIRINGQNFQTVSFTRDSLFEAARRVEIPMRLLHRGENRIEFAKAGEGACFYSAELTQTVVEPNMAPFSNLSGVKIERSYHRLVQERLETGRMRLVPSKDPLDRFEPGELVRVVLKITTDRPMQYLQIEDPVPSNCRVVEREDLDIGDDWAFWWNGLVLRDDRVSYFANHLYKGTFELSYTMRAEQPGVSSALPASVYEMYEPSSRAWTGLGRLEVR